METSKLETAKANRCNLFQMMYIYAFIAYVRKNKSYVFNDL